LRIRERKEHRKRKRKGKRKKRNGASTGWGDHLLLVSSSVSGSSPGILMPSPSLIMKRQYRFFTLYK
jgi:hypothetical protein